ncbi:hypothetical protein [Salipaludibacillus keqinensis]|nr:hypothetical protein [Salipaludibacillus keqinensis]
MAVRTVMKGKSVYREVESHEVQKHEKPNMAMFVDSYEVGYNFSNQRA